MASLKSGSRQNLMNCPGTPKEEATDSDRYQKTYKIKAGDLQSKYVSNRFSYLGEDFVIRNTDISLKKLASSYNRYTKDTSEQMEGRFQILEKALLQKEHAISFLRQRVEKLEETVKFKSDHIANLERAIPVVSDIERTEERLKRLEDDFTAFESVANRQFDNLSEELKDIHLFNSKMVIFEEE